jgi:hypothetical protein
MIKSFLPFLLLLLGVACSKDDTPDPELLSFAPLKGNAGTLVSIRGKFFGEDSLRTTVLFNGKPAARIHNYSDSLIIAEVAQATTTGKISVTVGDRTVNTSSDFVILPGTWTRKKDIPFSSFESRANAIGVTAGGFGFLGAGYNGGTTLKDFWKYEPVADVWSAVADCGIDFQAGISMVINGKLYTGLGQAFSQNPSIMKQIWEYDPATNSWTRKRDFPGSARWGAVGVSLGDKGYVGLGDPGGGSILLDWWEYDPGADSWTQKKDFPPGAAMHFAAAMVVNGRIYAGLSSYNYSNAWYEYLPATDAWAKRRDFPGKVSFSPAVFVLANKGYVAGGGEECWAYDPATDSWTQQAFIRNIIAGSAFSLNGKGYFLPGVGGGGSTGSFYWSKEVWEFTPAN